MSRVGIQLRRELSAYFMSPMGFVIMTILLLVTGIVFSLFLTSTQRATYQLVVGPLVIINFLITPVISMRLVADERRTGTLESLMTAPVKEWEVILAKYLGSVVFLAILYLPTLLYLAILFYYAPSPRLENGPEIPQTLTSYAALLLTGAVYLAVGLFISTLTRHQIVAAILAVLAGLMLWLFGTTGSFMAGSTIPTVRYLGAIFQHAGILGHAEALGQGIVYTADVVYFVSVASFFVFLSYVSLVLRK